MSAATLLFACLLPVAAWAADILGAHYDSRTDQLVVDIAYRGTHGEHDFVLHWGPCKNGEAAALGRVAHASLLVPEEKPTAAAPKPWLDVLASDLIGDRVSNAMGEDLGRIENVVVDLPREQVRYVVLSFNAENEWFRVPITALAPIIGTERLQLTIDRAMLIAKGGFAPGEWPDLAPWVAPATQLMRGEVKDVVLNFSTPAVRGIVLASGAVVAARSLASGAGAGGTRANPSDRASPPHQPAQPLRDLGDWQRAR